MTGEVLDYTASGAITTGVPFLLGTRLAIPLKSGVSGDVIPVMMEGVFLLTKATGAGTNWAQGGIVYWDDTAKKLTGVASGNTAIGIGALIAATADTTGQVKLYC